MESETAASTQLQFSSEERARLKARIETCFHSAIGDHQRRIARFDSYLKLWRQLCDDAIKEGDSAFSVPMLEWHVSGKLAQIVNLILGPDAELVAVPTGPSDHRIVHKIARFMQWRFFSYMKATLPAIVWVWLAVFFGRGFVYRPWRRDMRDMGDMDPVLDYDGPDLVPLNPNDILLPADDALSIHNAAWVIRRYTCRPDDLLIGEESGQYFGITEGYDEIVRYSKGNVSRDWRTDELKSTSDRAEGVDRGNLASQEELLQVWEWYGRWRLLLDQEKDCQESDLSGRELRETEIVVRMIPGLNRVISIQRLADLYPNMRRRRPFAELTLSVDGSAWPRGLGEQLYNLQNSVDANHRQFDKISRLTAMPPVFYDPAGGWDPEKDPMDAGVAIPTNNPQAVNVMKVSANLGPLVEREQMLLSYAERLSRVTEQNLGRSQPNVTTAAGQLALIEQANVGVAMDTTVLRQWMSILLTDLWELDCEFSDESTFFRVTEEDAKGLFDTADGGAKLTKQERGGRYDFDIKFATSVWSKSAQEQKAIQVYQLDMANPLVATNPKALWVCANKLHKALGVGDFSEIVPEPPDIDAPKRPEQEWALALQGEDIHVHPMDNDQMHLVDHFMRVAQEEHAKEPDQDAINKMLAHCVDHMQAKKEKALQMATVQAIAGPGGALQQLMGGAPQPGMMPGGGEQ